ncbi:MAG: phosphate ABC transporter permease PstA [Acidobacteria bacterium]|nr:phosphate ABC transporter permease PstA [Acidobacteriota bacterium]
MIDPLRYRKVVNGVMTGATFICALAVLAILFAILGYIVAQGIAALNIDFLTKLPKPVGESGGGIAHAIVGSMLLIGIAILLGLPSGILAGLYLAEFGKNKLGRFIEFVTDILAGTPSIIVGIFAYTLIVLPMKRFSAFAGGAALALIMIPIITRTTQEIIQLVPQTLREGALALGAPQWRVTLGVVLRSAAGGVATGVMLAIARVAGETAPLLFTALGSHHWSTALDRPVASLTVTIYDYAKAPYDDWHAQAWAGALVLVMMIGMTNLAVRLFTHSRYSGTHP